MYLDGQNNRYLLGGAWLFRPDRTDIGLGQGWGRDVSGTDGWSVLSVPNSFNAGDLSDASMAGYVGWYRRDFTVPGNAFASYVPAGDRHWIIRFESVNYRATVWLNGRQIGTHEGAYLPFELDLKGLRPGVNRLIVRVDNRRGPADLPPGPGGGWWNYGGILREVYLRAVEGVDLSQLQIRAVPSCVACSAVVTERATLRNLSDRRQTVRLRGAYGTAPIDFGTHRLSPGSTLVAHAVATIRHPRLWSPDHPNLYRATLTVTDARDRALGGWVTDSGIRTIAVTTGGRLLLNGRLLNLRGVNIHEQDQLLGGVLTPARTNQVIGWVQALGATLIRAHYPLSPELQELADRKGILLWSEVPVYQVRSQYLNQHTWLTRAYAQLQTNILTNQNHPSVLLWSIGNELTTPADAPEASYIAGASALAHKLDPTRPVGMAVSSWPGVACQSAYVPLDVIGFNDYFGWFDAGGGTTDDRDALGPFLDFFHACYPTKPLFVTEFGFDGNRTGPVEERGTYSFQSNAIAYHLGVFASKPWLSGAIYFALQDFAARPGWGGGNPVPDPPFVQKGVFDLQGNLKPADSVLSEIYQATVQIARGPARDQVKRGARGL
jgi:beta-glucuronidase